MLGSDTCGGACGADELSPDQLRDRVGHADEEKELQSLSGEFSALVSRDLAELNRRIKEADLEAISALTP